MKPTPEMLEALGITREDVLACTVKELTKQILGQDDEGEYEAPNLEAMVNRETRKFIDEKVMDTVRAECEKAFTPLIESKLADYTLQQTNSWGEKLGRTLTLTEFLVQRIDAYMMEEVDSNGRSQEECRARHDSFYKAGPRVTRAIHQYFHFHMDEAMKQVLKDSANILTEGIEKAAKNALGSIHERLVAKVEVKK